MKTEKIVYHAICTEARVASVEDDTSFDIPFEVGDLIEEAESVEQLKRAVKTVFGNDLEGAYRIAKVLLTEEEID